jgi:hypothetical protein|tara:strand:+ start:122 stop:1192 length:1071 start_codon:yes stop_codon:yes gene_type:complete
MPATPVNVEDFMAEGGIAATTKLILEVAKQVGVSTEFAFVEAKQTGIDVDGRARKDTLLKCEDTIREAVAEIIQNETPIVNALKDEKFCGSHLTYYPSTYTGIFLYYLCKGLYEDFGIWFNSPPVSLKERKSANKLQKSYDDGGRVITNKAARELRQMADMNTYMPDITSGKITMEEAIDKMKAAVEEIQKLTALGIELPSTATGKVKYFNQEIEARADKEKPDDRFAIFKQQDMEIKIPRVQEDLEFKCLKHKKYKTDVYNIKQSGNPLNHPDLIKIERETGSLTAKDILMKCPMAEKEVKEMDAAATIINCHVIKSKKKGTGRQRFICFDCQSKSKGQFLVFSDEAQMVSIVES